MPEQMRSSFHLRFVMAETGTELFRMPSFFVPAQGHFVDYTPDGGSVTRYGVQDVIMIYKELPPTPEPPEPPPDPEDYAPYIKVELAIE